MPDGSRSLGPDDLGTVFRACQLLTAFVERVWRLLEEPTTWKLWFADCREGSTHDRKLLRDGSHSLLEWTGGWFALNLGSQGIATQPERYLLLEVRELYRGSDWGCWFDLEAVGTRGTLGWHLLTQARMFSLVPGQRRPLNQTLKQNLRHLKRLAESR